VVLVSDCGKEFGYGLTCWHNFDPLLSLKPFIEDREIPDVWLVARLPNTGNKAQWFPVVVVGQWSNPVQDFAVLKIPRAVIQEFRLQPIPVSFSISPGMKVVAVGFQRAQKLDGPDAVSLRLSSNRELIKCLKNGQRSFEVESATLNPLPPWDTGMSGGAVIDEKSKALVGIAWGVDRNTTGSDQHRGYVVPLSVVLETWTKLEDYCRVIHDSDLDLLAQQTRNWFTSLRYHFEEHDVRTEQYFEWIISVPARHGYDRVLVRCFTREVQSSHINELGKAVEQHRADEGWVISILRISQAARDAARAVANTQGRQKLFCYTFDELLDQTADFTDYFNWLESEVRRRHIDERYVDLACVKDEFDLKTGEKTGESRYDERNGWIDGLTDCWLQDPARGHISILGEFGTGKTWFALHYAWKSVRTYLDAKARGLRRPRVPLYIPLRDYTKAGSLPVLFSDFFFRKHKIYIPGYDVFEELNRMGKLLLILDGFDEMAARVDRQKMINHFWELARVVVPGSKAILTGRFEHFPQIKERLALLNAELKASTANPPAEPPQFDVLKLETFNHDQIAKAIRLRKVRPEIADKILDNVHLMDFARRPVMIDYILEALPDVEFGKPLDLSRVYWYALKRKMERDIREERTFTSQADKLYFFCELAWEMLSSGRLTMNYRAFPESIRRLFDAEVCEQKDLDHWESDLRGNGMLIHDDYGNYIPAHKSLLEFFVAYKFVAQLGVLSSDFLELPRNQSHINLKAARQNYTWSDYFHSKLGPDGKRTPIAPLLEFVRDPALENLLLDDVDQYSRYQFPSNVMAFAARMLSTEPASLDRLVRMALFDRDHFARAAQAFIPHLKHEDYSRVLAESIVQKSGAEPLRVGVGWVLGELGLATPSVLNALQHTIRSLAEGREVSPIAWWEAAFALEKLGALKAIGGRKGDEPMRHLIDNLPSYATIAELKNRLNKQIACKSQEPFDINEIDVALIIKHEDDADVLDLFRRAVASVTFSSDKMKGRRFYRMVWLCGHLGKRADLRDECLRTVHAAAASHQSSVRNCAYEALGKIGQRDEETIKILEKGLLDEDYRARYHAAWSLGELGSSTSISRLSEAIRNEEVRDVRAEMSRVREHLRGLAQALHA
jgi:hypothetical protein